MRERSNEAKVGTFAYGSKGLGTLAAAENSTRARCGALVFSTCHVACRALCTNDVAVAPNTLDVAICVVEALNHASVADFDFADRVV